MTAYFLHRSFVNSTIAFFLLLFLGTACNPSKTPSTSPRDSSAEKKPITEKVVPDAGTPPSMVYVDMDTLLEKYVYYKLIKDQMSKKAQRLQSQAQAKQMALQKDIAAYNNNAANLTPDQKKSTEAAFQRRGQEFQAYQQNLSQQFGQEEQDLNVKIYDKIHAFLGQYCRDHHHQMVMSYTKGGGVLYADKSLDVTLDVLTGLNDAYQKESKNK